MDHRALLASFSPEERQVLTKKSDLQGLLHLFLHWGSIVLIGALIAFRVPGWFLLVPLQGVLIVFLFTLLHETCHDTPFESHWLNRIVGSTCGFLIFLPARWFRYFHFAHHRHTHDPEKDPELQGRKPDTWLAYVIYVSGLPVWRDHIQTILRNATGCCEDTFVPANAISRITLESRLTLTAYMAIAIACYVSGYTGPVYYWLLPIVFGQPFLRLYLLAEHERCPHVANMFENTRTTFTNFMVRKLAWNMPYHAEHHAYPIVPFYRLPELHRLARDHLRVTENGYTRFTRSYVAGLKQ